MTKEIELDHDDYEIIGRVMDNFNCQKVAKVMQLLDWIWVNSENETPADYEISRAARKLLKEALVSVKRYPHLTGAIKIGTGGLEVEYNDGFLTLRFVAARAEYDKEWFEQDSKF